MMYATKKNIQVKIDDDQAEAYAKQGYTILDKDGKTVPCSYHAPVPYEEHIKAVEAAKSTKVKDLEARIAELEAENAALKSGADEFQ